MNTDLIVRDAAEVVKNGGTILYPTDTIWGLGCDPFNKDAVDEIFKLKKRPSHKKLILIVSDILMLKKYIPILHPKIETLISFHKQPLTVIYNKNRFLPDYLLEEDGSIAIRVVQDDFCEMLIKASGNPLISTSANLHGEPFPESFGSIDDSIKHGVNYIVPEEYETKKKEPLPSIIAKLNKKEELDFIRT